MPSPTFRLMKTLYVTDLDGTLLGSDSTVSARSADLLNSLADAGAAVTVATARTPATVQPLLRGIRTLAPAVVMTGAALWDRATGHWLDTHLFAPDVAADAIAQFVRCGVSPFVYTLDGEALTVFHDRRLNRMEGRFYRERADLRLKRFVFGPTDPDPSLYPPVILLLGVDTTPRINVLADRLSADSRLSVSAYTDIFNSEQSFIEVFAAGVSKAAAVLRLKRELRADRLVVYGDNLNDLTMFAAADEAVAVANAKPEVIAAATRVIGPNYASAVPLDIAKCEGLLP